MTGDRRAFVALGRYLGAWPDRTAPDGSGRAIQVGFDVVPIPSIAMLEVWQAARECVLPDDTGVTAAALVEAIRCTRVEDLSRVTPPLRFPHAATLGDAEVVDHVSRLTDSGLLVPVPDDDPGLTEFLGTVRLFAGTDASDDVDRRAPGEAAGIRLANGRSLDPALFDLWAWSSVQDSLRVTHDLTGSHDPARTVSWACRLCAESGAFLDLAGRGIDRTAGSGLAPLVDVPSRIPSWHLDEPRWLGLRKRRTAGHTFALGQLSRSVDRAGRRFRSVRLGKGMAELDEAAYWSWSRAYGRAGNLGRRPVTEFPDEASAVDGGPEAAAWLIAQPLLFGIGGTDDDLVRQATQVQIAPRNWARDSTHDPPRPSSGGAFGIGFELAIFGHLEANLWSTVQAVAQQRADEGRGNDEGGTEPLEILRAFLLSPESAVKYAGYLDLA